MLPKRKTSFFMPIPCILGFFLCNIHGLLPSMLTAWNPRQFAIMPSHGTFDSIAPRPVPYTIRITAVIRVTVIFVWVSMRRLWLPTLTGNATGSYGYSARVTVCIYVFTWAHVWKKQVLFHFNCSRVSKCSPPRENLIWDEPATSLTLNVRGPSYLGLTRSISWLLIPWLLTSPGH